MAGALVALPLFVLVVNLFLDSEGIWAHLYSTVLWGYVKNTLILFVGVGVLSSLLGVTTAWMVTMYEFPLKKIMEWALVLPLAMPAYLAAYLYTDLFDFSGPINQSLIGLFNLQDSTSVLPNIKNHAGAIFLFSFVLYPYVYISCRAAFLEQSICVLEAAKSLGKNRIQVFWQIALPLARPGLIAGLSLVLMETLADFGTVDYFAIDTFTTGIYRAWFAMDSQVAASQLAMSLLTFVFILVYLERINRGRKSYRHSTNKYRSIFAKKCCFRSALMIQILLFIPLFFGFLLPLFHLVVLNFGGQFTIASDTIRIALNTLFVAIITSLLAVVVSFLVCYAHRSLQSKWIFIAMRILSMGYAVPGSVIAIGVMIPLVWLDHQIGPAVQAMFNMKSALIFSGSAIVLILAYLVRFISVALGSIESGLEKVSPSMDYSAKSLGANSFKLLKTVHFPMIRASILSAMLLVFVDVMKELPATLILRPFNYDTLAVRVYHMASDERLADAAQPAFLIILTGILPVVLLSRMISRSRPGHELANFGKSNHDL